MPPVYRTIPELARLTGRSTSLIRSRAAANQLPGARAPHSDDNPGRDWLIPDTEEVRANLAMRLPPGLANPQNRRQNIQAKLFHEKSEEAR